MNDFDTVNMNRLQKAVYYFREYGWEYTKNRALKKLGIRVPEESEYMNWLRKRSPGRKELDAQRRRSIPGAPVMDVVIDETPGLCCGSSTTRDTLPGDARELLKSLKGQTYPATGTVYRVSKERGDSLATLPREFNGEVVVFAQADTLLSPDLFHAYADSFAEHPDIELIYTDEDCGTADGKHRMRPYFKPDIAPELLLSFPYIGTVFAVRTSLLERIIPVLSREGIEPFGNGWYALQLAMVGYLAAEEPAIAVPDDIGTVHPRSVLHIPRPLFTKLVEKEPEGFYRVFPENQKEYVKGYLKRFGLAGEVMETDVPGFLKVSYALPEKKPLISILIPSKDHFEDLDKCIRSLLDVNEYPEFEIIIAENNSTEPETFAYYDRLTGQTYDADRAVRGEIAGKNGTHRITVVTWKDGFNFSGINNFAAKHAEGELLLLLNNDTEVRDPGTLTELVRSLMAPGVGASGAMLYYGDGTIQHGGIVYKIGGFAANALWSLTDRDEKYYPYSVTAREMSGCTAACLLLKREAFDAAGGFDETLGVALNDVDLCLKVRQAGYKILFNPYARLFHYESKSRGSEEENKEKQDRFNREIAYFQSKWQDEIDRGDPYYNVNQTLHYANYSIELAEDNRGRYHA